MTTNNPNYKRYALVTGATSGIGYELTQLLAQDGHNLILVGRTEVTLREMRASLSQAHDIDVQIITKDLFVPGAAKEIYEETTAKGYEVEVLVNDAGQGVWGKFADTDLDREIDIVHLNIIALISLTKYYVKDMLARNSGKILQVASQVSTAPSPYLSVYAATKAFVLSFSEALRQELKGRNVTVTALRPGATDTDFFHKAGAEHTVTYREVDLYDPKVVAAAGYEALMNGDDAVLPGMMNKVQTKMAGIMPDTVSAAMMEKQMEPSTKGDGRDHITHAPSARERERIAASDNSRREGDYNRHEGHHHEGNTSEENGR